MSMELVAMRLADMRRVHPAQDNSRACAKCGHRVGIYPSGQAALRNHPGMAIRCLVCAMQEGPPDGAFPAAPIEEILEESRQSRDVGRA